MPPGAPLPTAFDRPDLMTRVFMGRLYALLHMLTKLNVLGRCVAIHWSQEWQKRGTFHFFSVSDFFQKW